jgi:hypothetical protein
MLMPRPSWTRAVTAVLGSLLIVLAFALPATAAPHYGGGGSSGGGGSKGGSGGGQTHQQPHHPGGSGSGTGSGDRTGAGTNGGGGNSSGNSKGSDTGNSQQLPEHPHHPDSQQTSDLLQRGSPTADELSKTIDDCATGDLPPRCSDSKALASSLSSGLAGKTLSAAQAGAVADAVSTAANTDGMTKPDISATQLAMNKALTQAGVSRAGAAAHQHRIRALGERPAAGERQEARVRPEDDPGPEPGHAGSGERAQEEPDRDVPGRQQAVGGERTEARGRPLVVAGRTSNSARRSRRSSRMTCSRC